MKKVFAIVAMMIILCTSYAVFVLFSSGGLTKELTSYYVYDYTNQREVTGHREHLKRAPASLTKILSTMVSMGDISDASETLSIHVDSYLEMVEKGASMAGFYGNETITYMDAWMGTLLKSGGETINSLAIHRSGSKEAFVSSMNDVILSMGLKHSHFLNPEGLDQSGHYSSAQDVTMILNSALTSSRFREVFTTARYVSSKTMDHPDGITMENRALIELRELVQGTRILGVKTGTTPDAGLCLSGLVEKGGKEYLITLMGVPFEHYDDTHHYEQFKALCDAL